jgi:hypothetical protein
MISASPGPRIARPLRCGIEEVHRTTWDPAITSLEADSFLTSGPIDRHKGGIGDGTNAGSDKQIMLCPSFLI